MRSEDSELPRQAMRPPDVSGETPYRSTEALRTLVRLQKEGVGHAGLMGASETPGLVFNCLNLQ